MNKKIIRTMGALITSILLFSACQNAEEEIRSEESVAIETGAQESSDASTDTAESTEEEKEEPAPEPQNLVFWHSMSDEAGEVLDEVVAEFNNTIGKEKNITVEATYQGSYTDASTKLNAVTQSEQYEELPNIMQIDAQGIVTYNNCEKKYTIDDAMANDGDYDLSQYIPNALAAWNFEGVQAGLPYASSTTVMYYNKTLLDNAGITEAPTTFAEIIELSNSLPVETEAGDNIYAYANIPTSPDVANWIGQMNSASLNATFLTDNRNGRDGIATTLTCGTDGSLLTFIEEWKEMYDEGEILNQAFGLTDVFVAGQIACVTGSSSSLNSLLEMIGDSYELGVAYFPRVNQASNFGATISGSGMFMFDKDNSDENAAAWEFVKYMTSADVQAKISAATGYFPCNTGSMETEIMEAYILENPLFEVSLNQVNDTESDMAGIIVGPSYEVYLEFMNVIGDGVDAGTSPQEMNDMITENINGYLQQYLDSNN